MTSYVLIKKASFQCVKAYHCSKCDTLEMGKTFICESEDGKINVEKVSDNISNYYMPLEWGSFLRNGKTEYDCPKCIKI